MMHNTYTQLIALANKLDEAGLYVEAERLDEMVRRITQKRAVPVNQYTKQPVYLDPKHENNILSDHKLLEDDLPEAEEGELVVEERAA